MAIVIDASVLAAHLLPDEANQEAVSRILARLNDEDGVVPPIFRYEIRNILLMAKRRRRIDDEQLRQRLTELAEIALVDDTAGSDTNVLELADRLGLTVYDAAYLEVAKRRRAALATFDAELARAAGDEQVTVLGHGESLDLKTGEVPEEEEQKVSPRCN